MVGAPGSVTHREDSQGSAHSHSHGCDFITRRTQSKTKRKRCPGRGPEESRKGPHSPPSGGTRDPLTPSNKGGNEGEVVYQGRPGTFITQGFRGAWSHGYPLPGMYQVSRFPEEKQVVTINHSVQEPPHQLWESRQPPQIQASRHQPRANAASRLVVVSGLLYELFSAQKASLPDTRTYYNSVLMKTG